MNKKVVANELLKLAKKLVADYGDITLYFNVFDLVENKNELDENSIRILKNKFGDIFYSKFSKNIQKEMLKELSKSGLPESIKLKKGV